MSVPPRLVWITDRSRADRPLAELAAELVSGGVEAVQLREGDLDDGDLLDLARELQEVVAARGGRLLVNDRVDVALACGAAGVQLKSDGLGIGEARRMASSVLGEAGAGFLIGRSCHDGREVAAAFCEGADFVTLSPLAASPGKQPLGRAGLRGELEAARRWWGGPLPAWLALGGVGPEDSAFLAAAAEPGERWGVAAIRAFQGTEGCAVARELAERLGLSA